MRIGRTADLDLIRRLDRECFPDDEPVSIPNGSVCWVATREDQPIAFQVAHFLDYDNSTYLERVGVCFEARGLGLQRRLMRSWVRWSKSIGARYAITYTLTTNPYSSNNMISCGFELYYPRTRWVGDEVLYWRKAVD